MRVSGKGQVEGDAFRDNKERSARTQGLMLQIVRVFKDEGISGTKDLENRPALADLVRALHSNGVSLVLVERLDRLVLND